MERLRMSSNLGSPYRNIHTITSDSTRVSTALFLSEEEGTGVFQIVVGKFDGSIEFISLETFQTLATLKGHRRPIRAMTAFASEACPVRLLISTSYDNAFRFWDLQTMSCLGLIHPFVGNCYSTLVSSVRVVLSEPSSSNFPLEKEEEERGSLPKKEEPILFGGFQDTSVKAIRVRPLLFYFLCLKSRNTSLSQSSSPTPPRSCNSSSSSSPSPCSESFLPLSSSLPYPRSRLQGTTNILYPQKEGEAEKEEENIPKISMEEAEEKGWAGVGYGHNGFVYSLAFNGATLFSGDGDGQVSVWDVTVLSSILKKERTLTCSPSASINSIVVDSQFLYCAGQDQLIYIWDLKTLVFVRTISHHLAEVGSLGSCDNHLLSVSLDGEFCVWEKNTFSCVQTLEIENTDLMKIACSDTQQYCAIAFGSKVHILHSELENESDPACSLVDKEIEVLLSSSSNPRIQSSEKMFSLLREFITIPSVSSDESHRMHCWDSVRFLSALMEEWGFSTTLVETKAGRNPVLLGRCLKSKGKKDGTPKLTQTVTFYGHYDVVPADDVENWVTPPFQLEGRDGYLYARGVTDNKGPMLATLFAVKELLDENELDVNVNFIIEGEEECRSEGLQDALLLHKERLSETDLLLLSNSQWLADDTPCLLFGMRGIIRMEVEVIGPSEDLHSGINGGIISEPMIDLTHLLASLVQSDGRVLVPGFYDDILPVSEEEQEIYSRVNFDMKELQSKLGVNSFSSADPLYFLMRRWRYPTLSINGVKTPTLSGTVIPRSAVGFISIRTVPNMQPEKICKKVIRHIERKFQSLLTTNELVVRVVRQGDWWLGEPKSAYFNAAEMAIKDVWGVSPLLTRSGGTMATMNFLEQTLECQAIQVPMGQLSDNQHLPNERIRIENLLKGKQVFKNLLSRVPSSSPSPLSSLPSVTSSQSTSHHQQLKKEEGQELRYFHCSDYATAPVSRKK